MAAAGGIEEDGKLVFVGGFAPYTPTKELFEKSSLESQKLLKRYYQIWLLKGFGDPRTFSQKVLGGCRAEPYKPKFVTPQKQKGHPKIGMSFSNYIRKDQNFRSTSTGIPVLSDSKAASMMSISTIISWWVTICSHSPSMARTQLR